MHRLFVLLILAAACSNNASNNWQPLDLLPYGIPLTINAPEPDSAKVKKSDMGSLIQDITIRNGEDYYIQIYAVQAETNDMTKIKASLLADVKANRYYSRIVSEEESGFIYETSIDENNLNYGFRWIKLQGDMEYVFQTGLVGTFTLEQVKNMYEAVK